MQTDKYIAIEPALDAVPVQEMLVSHVGKCTGLHFLIL